MNPNTQEAAEAFMEDFHNTTRGLASKDFQYLLDSLPQLQDLLKDWSLENDLDAVLVAFSLSETLSNQTGTCSDQINWNLAAACCQALGYL
jgi:hypothetical protein